MRVHTETHQRHFSTSLQHSSSFEFSASFQLGNLYLFLTFKLSFPFIHFSVLEHFLVPRYLSHIWLSLNTEKLNKCTCVYVVCMFSVFPQPFLSPSCRPPALIAKKVKACISCFRSSTDLFFWQLFTAFPRWQQFYCSHIKLLPSLKSTCMCFSHSEKGWPKMCLNPFSFIPHLPMCRKLFYEESEGLTMWGFVSLCVFGVSIDFLFFFCSPAKTGWTWDVSSAKLWAQW